MTGADYYLAADVRELDRIAIEEKGIPGFTLMQRAGQALFEELRKRWPRSTSIICFCGSGNNGGDGYVVAALAKDKGLEATVVTVGDPDSLKGDALTACQLAESRGVPLIPFEAFRMNLIVPGTVVVDAMLGTGLSGEVRGVYRDAINLINTLDCPVAAADIPSGLCSDTGKTLGTATQAELTVTFIGRKLGQVIEDGPALCGTLVFNDLGVPPDIYDQINPPQN